MVKTKLETELRSGISRFVLRGTAVIDDKTFPREDTVSDSGWKYRRSSFAVKVGDNNYQYVELMGGRSSENPVIYTLNNDNEPFQVKWDLRTNKTVLENIPNRGLRLYPIQAVIIIGMMLTESEVAEKLRSDIIKRIFSPKEEFNLDTKELTLTITANVTPTGA